MTYNNVLKKISAFMRSSGTPTTERMKLLCHYIGDPQKKLKFVHIVGTNGKGSCAAMLDSVLREAGYRVGRYISPFVLDFRERMTVDGEMIEHTELCELCAVVLKAVSKMKEDIEKARNGEPVPFPIIKSVLNGRISDEPVQFEIVTAIAFLYFLTRKCDIVVLECGLGGKYDATNVIDAPIAAVIMSIGLDHTELLGDTVAEIAEEKCGIIKQGTREVISSPQYPEAYTVIASVCALYNNRLTVPVKADMHLVHTSFGGLEFTYRGKTYRTRMPATYQMVNASTVIETVFALRRVGMIIPDTAIENGLEKAWFPARFEILGVSPTFIVDGAHNEPGINAFCESLKALSPQIKGKCTFVIGMLRDKNPEKSLMPFVTLISSGCIKTDRILTLTPNSPRAMKANELAAILGELIGNSCSITPITSADNLAPESNARRKAVTSEFGMLDHDDALISFGSLYLGTEMRGVMREYLDNIVNM